jgi:predicted exporter
MASDSEAPRPEERRETYAAVALVGWIIFLFDALVLFFLPSGWRHGQRYFLPLTVAIGVIGLGTAITGHVLKSRVKSE